VDGAMIACSRMYNVTPAVREAWDRAFEHAARVSGVPLEIVAHAAPAPLDELWARDDMGSVLMCGWPFAEADPQPHPTVRYVNTHVVSVTDDTNLRFWA